MDNNPGLPAHVNDLVNLFASYMDRPNDPSAVGSLQDPSFFKRFDQLTPPDLGYASSDIGVLQQNPQYRGLRMILPQSGASYATLPNAEGGFNALYGEPRIMTEGPVGMPMGNDPHRNNLPIYPPNYPMDMGAMQQQIYGELIRRGYPVYGGNGQLPGFPIEFNPVGFGQR